MIDKKIFKTTVDFMCPFCKRDAGVVVDGVVHAMPPCTLFASLGPTEFMKAVNKAYGVTEKVRPS